MVGDPLAPSLLSVNSDWGSPIWCTSLFGQRSPMPRGLKTLPCHPQIVPLPSPVWTNNVIHCVFCGGHLDFECNPLSWTNATYSGMTYRPLDQHIKPKNSFHNITRMKCLGPQLSTSFFSSFEVTLLRWLFPNMWGVLLIHFFTILFLLFHHFIVVVTAGDHLGCQKWSTRFNCIMGGEQGRRT